MSARTEKYIIEATLLGKLLRKIGIQLKPNSVSTEKIADKAVTKEKLSDEVIRAIGSRDLSQADWNEINTESGGYIKNKPTKYLSTSGSYPSLIVNDQGQYIGNIQLKQSGPPPSIDFYDDKGKIGSILASRILTQETSTVKKCIIFTNDIDAVWFGGNALGNISSININTSGTITAASGVLNLYNGTINMQVDSSPGGMINGVAGINMVGGSSISGVQHITMETGNIQGVNQIHMGRSGLLNNVQKLYFVDNGDAEIDLMQGKIQGVQTLEMLTGVTSNIRNVSGIYMSTGGTVSMDDGTIEMYGDSEILGINSIAMATGGGLELNSGTITGVDSITMYSGGTLNLNSGSLRNGLVEYVTISGCSRMTMISGATIDLVRGNVTGGSIGGMVYTSGNSYTSGYINELKAALGLTEETENIVKPAILDDNNIWND